MRDDGALLVHGIPETHRCVWEALLSIELRLQPVDASFSLKDHIYRVLKDSFMELDIFNPEVWLRMVERRLAEGLGFSRRRVGEALLRLEREGFVGTLAGRAFFFRRNWLAGFPGLF